MTGATCVWIGFAAGVFGLLWANAWSRELNARKLAAVPTTNPCWYVAEVRVRLKCRTCHGEMAETAAVDAGLLELVACPLCGATSAPP